MGIVLGSGGFHVHTGNMSVFLLEEGRRGTNFNVFSSLELQESCRRCSQAGGCFC